MEPTPQESALAQEVKQLRAAMHRARNAISWLNPRFRAGPTGKHMGVVRLLDLYEEGAQNAASILGGALRGDQPVDEQPKDLIARLDRYAQVLERHNPKDGTLVREARSTITALREQVERLTEERNEWRDAAHDETAKWEQVVQEYKAALEKAQGTKNAEPYSHYTRDLRAKLETAERALSEAQQEIEGLTEKNTWECGDLPGVRFADEQSLQAWHRWRDAEQDAQTAAERERDALRAALKAGVGTHGEVCHNPECEFLVQARAALGEADQETHHD